MHRLVPTPRSLLVCALLLFAGTLSAACGDGGDAEDGQGVGARIPKACGLATIDVRAARVPRPIPGLYWGQEIWLTYRSEEYGIHGVRATRSREEALDLARKLCAAVHGGEDIGVLARKYSNGMGGVARGFAVVPEPSHRSAPDARDIALMNAEVGEITPLIEWRGGFWFARRIPPEQGRQLGDLLQREASKRARARVIHIHHRDAWPRRHQFDQYTKQQAVEKAWALIREIQRGKDFAALARLHSNDKKTRENSGLLTTIHPITKEPTEWVRWGDRNFSQPLLDVLLEKGVPGKLWPEPVISGQGVDVVFLVERKSDP